MVLKIDLMASKTAKHEKSIRTKGLELVSITRQFPPELRDVSFEEIAADALSEFGGHQAAHERTVLINRLLASTEGFEHFDLSGLRETDRGAAYEFARNVTRIIRWIAYDTMRPFPFAETLQAFPGLPAWVRRVSPARLTLKESGLQPFYEILRSTLLSLDPSRIRMCEACETVFWADRKDKAACSKPCANRARVRRWYSRPEHAQRAREEKRKLRKRISKDRRKRG
jgi:hypothetical protein